MRSLFAVQAPRQGPQAKGQAMKGPLDGAQTRVELIEFAQLILDDWLHHFAPEFCNDEDVARTRSRINAHGGTLGYIADCNVVLAKARAKKRGKR